MGEGSRSALPGNRLQVGTQVSITAATPTVLQAATPAIQATQSVVVQAPSTNTASIWVGGSDVSSTKGMEIQPGGAFPVEVCDPSKIYVYAAGSGQKANYSWV